MSQVKNIPVERFFLMKRGLDFKSFAERNCSISVLSERHEMNKQTRLNQFVRNFCAYIAYSYSTEVKSVEISEADGFVKGMIRELEGGGTLELWADYEEIIVIYGQSHWHVNEYNDPCQYEVLYREAIEIVFAVMKGKLVTYSVWAGNDFQFGGSFEGGVKEAVADVAQTFYGTTKVITKVWGSEETHHAIGSSNA